MHGIKKSNVTFDNLSRNFVEKLFIAKLARQECLRGFFGCIQGFKKPDRSRYFITLMKQSCYYTLIHPQIATTTNTSDKFLLSCGVYGRIAHTYHRLLICKLWKKKSFQHLPTVLFYILKLINEHLCVLSVLWTKTWLCPAFVIN